MAAAMPAIGVLTDRITAVLVDVLLAIVLVTACVIRRIDGRVLCGNGAPNMGCPF
jgi:hypothetical protein